MLWQILLGAACGAVAGALAALVPNAKQRRTTQLLVFVGAMVVLNAAARPYVLPRLRAFEARRDAAKAFRQNRMFAVVATRHPEMEAQFTEMMVEAAKSGASQADANARATAWGQQAVGPLLQRYLPTASDAALATFVDGSLVVLRAFDKQGDDSCFRWMFPAAATPSSQPPKLDAAQEKQMIDAMTLVFESAFASAAKPLPSEEAAAVMERFALGLGKKHGQAFLTAVAALAEAPQDLQGRRRACATTMTMYEEAVALPPEQRAKVLRSMFQ